MKWSGGLVDGLSSSWTETTATEPLRCSKKLCILCVCMIILCSLQPHQQTCQRCLIMSTKNFIDGRSLSTKIAHFNYDCFIVKYPNLKWRQLVYVPICNGLLCSPSFLCNQTLSNIADMSAPPSPTLHQQTTSDSHNTPANAAMLINQLTVTCSGEIFGLVVTDMQIHLFASIMIRYCEA